MARLPPLETLRVFEVACRLGSYSEAARELHVTHSAVSQRIRQLEEELGQTLFERQGNRMMLTSSGLRLQAGVKSAFTELGAAFGSINTRRPVSMVYSWEAPALAHGPIYFQDVNLERYGYSHGALQPFYSGFHFLSHLLVFPYLVGAYPQCDDIYTLGYYRPGSCAPYQHSRPRFSVRGLMFEGGAAAGMAYGYPYILP